MYDYEELQNRRIKDGVYDVTGLEVLMMGQTLETKCENSTVAEVEDFQKRHPDWVSAEAYETEYMFLLSATPPKFAGSRRGNGFNYGSSNILFDCPKNILILAEND